MRSFFILLAAGLFSQVTLGQISYQIKELGKLPVKAVVDPKVEVMDLAPLYNYHVAPHPDGGKYGSLKKAVAERFPRVEEVSVQTRADLPTPDILSGFRSNGRMESVPPDNTLAVGLDGVSISAVNSHVNYRDPEGNRLFTRSLDAFSQGLAAGAGKFDPRAIYDPEQNRFIMTWLAGNSSDLTSILVAFSSSEDILEPWHVIEIPGSPTPSRWSDYPMIAITDEELFLTINLIIDNETWQEGFDGTLIYQIDKMAGFAGSDPEVRMWNDIRFDGEFIRNLHPVKAADENLHSDMHFLSNRNFALQNDSIFILNLTGNLGDADTNLDIDVRSSDTAYGAPPNGRQMNGPELATNDARILDGYRLGSSIQFVSNTVDPATGNAAVYHGIIRNLSDDPSVTSRILPYENRDLGYPAIAWTGRWEGDDEAIIVAQYSGSEDYPGIAASFSAFGMYSDWLVLAEGQGIIDFDFLTVERWGDYTGCQRDYGAPGIVWTGSSFSDGTRYEARTTVLSKSQETSTVEVDETRPAVVTPNPVSQRMTVMMEVPRKERLHLALYSSEGRLVKLFYNTIPKKVGELEFSFDVAPLPSGLYFLSAHLGGEEVLSQRVVKE